MAHLLYRKQLLNCDLKTAWSFFTAPGNLARITPPNMKFTVISNVGDIPIYKGMLIDYKVAPLFGLVMRWRTEITQVEKEKNFTDLQIKGPYKLWRHVHQFIPNERGVWMIDTVEYELPFGIFGRVGHPLVKKRLKAIFDYRYQILEKIFNRQTIEQKDYWPI